jgi:hypothetical protein
MRLLRKFVTTHGTEPVNEENFPAAIYHVSAIDRGEATKGSQGEGPRDRKTIGRFVGHRAVRSRPRFYIHTLSGPELL